MTDARRFARIVISQDELATLHEMREMLLQHEKARLLLKGGKAELSIFWNHPEYGYLCKCRPDYLREDLKVIVDYKTCIDASPEGFGRAVYNFRYHNQAEWYAGVKGADRRRLRICVCRSGKDPALRRGSLPHNP